MKSNRNNKKGKFIVLEGGDGSGKTTILNYLKEIHGQESFVFTREPGGSPFAEKIRELMLGDDAKDADGLTHMCLAFAARRDHVNNTILPALKKGINVISDRFDSSTWAYQIYGQQSPFLKRAFFVLRSEVLNGLKPDAYIVLDLDASEGMKRSMKRKSKDQKNNFFDEKSLFFHQKIREGLRHLPKNFKTYKIDASQPLDAVKQSVNMVINKILNI